MKQEEIERLQAICEKEGFKLKSLDHGDLFVIKPDKKVDEWENVEFVECLTNCQQYTIGKIYKVKHINGPTVFTCLDNLGSETNGWVKSNFKPSTQEAYVEQLKKEAFERFGEIKVGDRFKTEWDGWEFEIDHDGIGFHYIKTRDMLVFNGWDIYKQGKWATKIEEVKVEPSDVRIYRGFPEEIQFRFRTNLDGIIKSCDTKKAGQYLAEKLEEFINSTKQ